MGVECSTSSPPLIIDDNPTNPNNAVEFNPNETSEKTFQHIFYFKNYRQYSETIRFLNNKFKDIMSKVIQLNHFIPPKKIKTESDFIYYRYFDYVTQECLYNYSVSIYQKIGNVYGNSQNYPKEELGKITYGLIAKYHSYEYENDDALRTITEKIIKRINFFSEEFPFKLRKLDKIILSRKIFVFGYDKNLKLNFYIEPNGNTEQNNKNLIGKTNNTELDENLFYFKEKYNTDGHLNENTFNIDHNKNQTFITYADYITYIFFIIEHVLPLFIEKFSFSPLVNITINFGGKEADTELISYIMTYFTNFYPLGLGKVHIVNFKVDLLKKNKTFKNELENLDYYRNLVFHNESYQFQLVKDTNINCLPIAYGGYHSLSGYTIQNDFKLDDFIKYTLSMILINSNI